LTFATLATMRMLARQAVTDPVVVWTARNLAAQTGDGHQLAAVAYAIRNFLLRTTVYVADPTDREMLSPPRAMLDQITQTGRVGIDCDEVAVLGAALAFAVGIPVMFRSYQFQGDRFFSHVAAFALTSDGPISFDTQTQPPGLVITRVYDFQV